MGIILFFSIAFLIFISYVIVSYLHNIDVENQSDQQRAQKWQDFFNEVSRCIMRVRDDDREVAQKLSNYTKVLFDNHSFEKAVEESYNIINYKIHIVNEFGKSLPQTYLSKFKSEIRDFKLKQLNIN
jgi:CHASE3 domain sensor protein